MKQFSFAFVFLFSVLFSTNVYAQNTSSLSELAIVIDKFELKDSQGQWHTVIEPDKKVDLAEQNFYFSFFNNDRVSAGDYTNFRLTVSDKDAAGKYRVIQMTAKENLSEALKISKISFIGVETQVICGTVDYPVKEIDFIEVTVDERVVKVNTDEILKV